MKNGILSQQLERLNSLSVDIIEKESCNRLKNALNMYKFKNHLRYFDDVSVLHHSMKKRIALTGTIKAGKSSLINAILEQEVSTVDVTPETSTIIEYTYGKRHILLIYFYTEDEWKDIEKTQNNMNCNIYWEQFFSTNARSIAKKYIGTRWILIECSDIQQLIEKISFWSSSKNGGHFFVKKMIVEFPEAELLKDIILVDTPGLNDPIKMRSDLSEKYIKKADKILMCIKTDCMTESELNYVKKVVKFIGIKNFWIIGTQLDSLNDPLNDWNVQKDLWIRNLEQIEKTTNWSERIFITSAYAYLLIKRDEKDKQIYNSKIYWEYLSIVHKFRIDKSKTPDVSYRLFGIDSIREFLLNAEDGGISCDVLDVLLS